MVEPIELVSTKVGREFDNVTPKYLIGFAIKIKGVKNPLRRLSDGRTLVTLETLNELESSGVEFKYDLPSFVFEHVDYVNRCNHWDAEKARGLLGDSLWSVMEKRLYQCVTVVRFLNLGKVWVLDDMGTGKTIQGMMCYWAARCRGDVNRVVIVCPSSLKFNWKYELLKFLPLVEEDIFVIESLEALNPNTRMRKRKFYREKDYKVVIMSFGIARTMTQKGFWFDYDMLIVDECHNVSNYDAQCTRALLLMSEKVEYKLLMTGTACDNAKQVWTQMRMLYPNLYPKFFDNVETEDPDEDQLEMYAHRYCNPVREVYDMWVNKQRRKFVKWVFKGVRRAPELNSLLRSFMIRRKKTQVLRHLPPKNRSRIVMKPLGAAELAEIQDVMNKEKEKKVEEKVDADGDIVKSMREMFTFTRTVQLTAKYKRKQSLQFVDEIILKGMMKTDPDRKVLFFCHSKDTRVELGDLLDKRKVTWCTIHGEMKAEDKAIAAKEFQEDKWDTGIMSIKAAGAGFTLTRASLVIFLDLLYSPKDHLQAEDRISRIGQTRVCDIWYLISPGTSDDMCWSLIQNKHNVASQIVDGHKSFLKSDKVEEDELSVFRSPAKKKCVHKKPRIKKINVCVP